MNADSAAPRDPATDPRPVHERAAEQMARLFDAVGPGDLTAPTPCAGFDVGSLLSHVVGGTLRTAQAGEGGGPGEVDPDARVDSGLSGVPEKGWREPYAQARERFAAAWADDAKLDAPVTVPWGTMPGRVALAGCVMEVVTHSWDLAQALGRQDLLDPALGTFALGVARQAVPEERGEGMPFGPPVSVPEDADDYGRLAAWLGREWDAGARTGGDGPAGRPEEKQDGARG
ncbi:TIGR03086 family metal-binding protein [Streptomyces sp. WMMB 322]|uniref:TIGR03086 family metal-binding protein n=1 Tax=Streptomyces sp. WMMB 322 TaxID=1286821 RepID=UPI0008238167|nr:TIGR03086 family metal-binding protein [Streptomyces sp. WMMB 322]SCK14105.1 TIGR03086 family protein [Streptomyces sp. WMMB 322]